MRLLKNRQKFASQDYTPSMLPHNRKEVFFDVIQLHWSRFLLYGIGFFLLSLPLHLLSLSETAAVWDMAATAETISESLQARILAVKSATAFLKIPCLLLLALGLAGFIRVIRQYAWMENVLFWKDFLSGIKNNGKQMLLLGLLAGLVYALSNYALHLSNTMEDAFMTVLLRLPLGVSVLFALPTAAYTVVAVSVYKNRIGRQCYLGFALYVSNFWKTLLTLGCFIAPAALQLIPNWTVMLLGRVLCSLLFPLILLAWTLFVFNQFDKNINAKTYPQLVNKGLASYEDTH